MDLNPALKIAVADFKKTDFSSITFRSGAIVAGQEVQVCYLNRKYSICLPEVAWEDGVSLREKIIILHYLTRSKGTPLSGKAIDFREVPGGNLYYPIFEARVHRPFLKTFGAKPKLPLLLPPPLRGRIEVGGYNLSRANLLNELSDYFFFGFFIWRGVSVLTSSLISPSSIFFQLTLAKE